jgi:hypothetical protein
MVVDGTIREPASGDEHSRHRSVFNFLVNLLAGLVAYTYQPKKPSLNLEPKGSLALPPAIF